MQTNRRALLKLLGLGAVVVAVPSIAQEAPPPPEPRPEPETTITSGPDYPGDANGNPHLVTRGDIGLGPVTAKGFFA